MTIQDVTYLHRRMIASYDAAERAQHPKARDVHLKLARLYQEKWQVGRTDDIVPPLTPAMLQRVLDTWPTSDLAAS